MTSTNKYFTEYPFNFICPNCKLSLHVSIQEKCDTLNAHRDWNSYVDVKCQVCGYRHLFHVHWTPYLVSDDTESLEIDEDADYSLVYKKREE